MIANITDINFHCRIYLSLHIRFFLEQVNFNVSQVNEYLNKNKFSFYGSTIALHAEDKVQALENELVRDYHVRLEEAEQEKFSALSEH